MDLLGVVDWDAILAEGGREVQHLERLTVRLSDLND
jgi:hypothetical protein